MKLREDLTVEFDNHELKCLLVNALSTMIQHLVAEGSQEITFPRIGTLHFPGGELEIDGLHADIVIADNTFVALVRISVSGGSAGNGYYTVVVDIENPYSGFKALAVYEDSEKDEDNIMIEFDTTKRDFVVPARG